MGGSVLTGFANLPVADKRLINEICERFEDCLKQGETTRAEEFASDLTVPLRSILLQELLLLECEYRFRRMNPPLEEELNCRLKGDEEICRVILSAARENSLCHAPLGERPGLFPEYARWLEATGQFKILRVLGRGGFGVVFQADSSRLGGYVALKVPLAGPSAPREFRDRFLREGRAVSRLEHPNIAATLEVSEAGPLCYIASEYVAGLHLGEWLAERGGALCPQEAANLIRTLSRAIAYAHENDVLHCDLKPANILMPHGSELNPKIVDFGLAKLREESSSVSRSGQVLGTPLYMAPEQAAGARHALTSRTDVYGLGAILYELLTGRTPFLPGPVTDVLHRVQHEEPIGPRAMRPEIPSELEAICLKCLEKQPSRRYATADELAEDISRFIEGKRTFARPRSLISRASRWCRRHPSVVMVCVSAAFAFAGISWGWIKSASALHAERAARKDAETTSRLATVLVSDIMGGRGGRLDAKEAIVQNKHLRTDLQEWRPYGRKRLAANSEDAPIILMLAYVNLMLANLQLNDRLFEPTRESCLEAIPLWRQLLVTNSDDLRIREFLAETLQTLSTSYLNEERRKDALPGLVEAESEFARLVHQGSRRAPAALAECQYQEADCKESIGQKAEAQKLWKRLREDLDSRIARSPKEIWCRNLLRVVLHKTGDFEAACQESRALMELRPRTDYRGPEGLGQSLLALAKARGKRSIYEEALPWLESAAAMMRKELEEGPENLSLSHYLSQVEGSISECRSHLISP